MGSIKILFIVAVLMLGVTGLAVAATGNQATPADDGGSGSQDGTVSDDISAVMPATAPAGSSAAASAVYGGNDEATENEDSISVDDESTDDESMDDESTDQESFDDESTSDVPVAPQQPTSHDSTSGSDSVSVGGHAGADTGSSADSGDDKS